MDSHQNFNYMSYQANNQQQPSLSSFADITNQQHQPQDSPSGHTTLPPLQSQQNGGLAHFGSLSYAHPSASHTPTTPHTPVSANTTNSTFSHISPTTTTGSMLPPSSFANQYGMSQSMNYPSTSAVSGPNNLTATSTSMGLPTIRPMPPGGVALPSLGGRTGLLSTASFTQNEEAPTHVVGSQGRRGILPSAPGRPNPPATAPGIPTKSVIPQKDASGKFPCPHCNKSYLHAKHLKRHLLRHTGDRPYMCHLCKDTFSRSDILKRHFQKCSIRRGNPTGANHLAHQRRNTNASNRLSISDGPIGLAGLQDVAGPATYTGNVVGTSPNLNGDISGRSSRANSIITPSTLGHRNSIAGLGILGSTVPGMDHSPTTHYPQPSQYPMPNGTSQPGQMQSNYAFNAPPMPSSNMYNHQNSNPNMISFLGQQSSRFDHSHNDSPQSSSNIDWTRMFNQGGQDGFIGGQTNSSSQQMQPIKTEIKTEDQNGANRFMNNDHTNDSFLGSLYSHPSAFGEDADSHCIPGFPNCNIDDPLQAKADALTNYCFPGGASAGDSASEIVRYCVSVENLKHFLEHYTSFHGHWPIIHMPTFKVADANNGLLLTMICVGAIYSPKLDMHQVRLMMQFVRSTVENSSGICSRTVNGQTEGLGMSPRDVEEIQALIMIQTMFTWHGDPSQRDAARGEFSTLAVIAKAMGLTKTATPGHYAYSVLHYSLNGHVPQFDISTWDWQGWLEQEKRNRALYLLFLTDAAMAMYFNCTPQFDPVEVRLSLPADDEAWDAKDRQECANALGLNGPSAQGNNFSGTRQARQPMMRDVMRILFDPNTNLKPGVTNVYAKFVLIHALHTRVFLCQRILFSDGNATQGFPGCSNGSAPNTPLSQNDFFNPADSSGTLSAANSGHATPTDSLGPVLNMQAMQEKKRLSYALDKWKRMWDQDMELQYPPGLRYRRRFGFSRDGVHFFYLARSFMQSQRGTDWTAPADTRFKLVMSLLKRIKHFVMNDNEHRGQDIGSVGDIDAAYGLDNLTLDMKLLFRPYNQQIDSPVAGVQTHSL